LEAMASGCVCITRPVGNVEHVYGNSKFVIRNDFTAIATKLVKSLLNNPQILEHERDRVRQRVAELDFSTTSVCRQLITHLA